MKVREGGSDSGRLYAYYQLHGTAEQVEVIARALTVEETIEFPAELVSSAGSRESRRSAKVATTWQSAIRSR